MSDGVCTIRSSNVGRVSGTEPNLMVEVLMAAKVIRQRSEIRDAVLDISGNLL